MKRLAKMALWLGATCSACSARPNDSSADSTGSAASEAVLPADVTPANWSVRTPADAPTPGTEPINVILTTDFTLDTITGALGSTFGADVQNAWHTVETGTGFKPGDPEDWKKLAKGGACISPELANIDGATGANGDAAQELSMRVAGCFPGVILEGESHIRVWESKARAKSMPWTDATGKIQETRNVRTYFIAASQEHLCDVDIDGKTKKWHCILPVGFVGKGKYANNGFSVKAPTGGYDKGRDDFVSDLKDAAALRSDWIVSCHDVARPASDRTDGLRVIGTDKKELARVPFDGKATYCTVLNKKYADCTSTDGQRYSTGARLDGFECAPSGTWVKL